MEHLAVFRYANEDKADRGEMAGDMRKNGRKTKPEHTRWNLLFILEVLRENTDEAHPMSVGDICKKVNDQFAHFADGDSDKVMSVDTVKRTLDALVCEFFELRDPERESLAFGVYCVVKAKGKYRPCEYGSEDDEGLKRYYYYDGKFSVPEVRTLIDAIETYSYFGDTDVCAIVRKLIRLRPCDYKGKHDFDAASEERTGNPKLMHNINFLCGCIDAKQDVEIEYCYYNEKKELVLRPGYPKVVRPIKMMWGNGYYYLLSYNEKYDSIVHYRVDRIGAMKAVEVDRGKQREAVSIPKINPVKYHMEHPVMYGGATQRFVMLCRDTGKNYIVNTIMDVFGKNARIWPAPDKMLKETFGHDQAYYAKDGIKWLKVSFDSTPSGAEMWATQYCTDCVIVSPEESRRRVRERLEEGIGNYQ